MGIEFSWSTHGIFTSQRKYMLDILDDRSNWGKTGEVPHGAKFKIHSY